MKFIIYKYTCPENRSYIGITKNPETRKKQHRRKESDISDLYPFAVAIRKFGYDSFTYEVIDEANSVREANEKEIYWIKKLNTTKTGYNLSLGGFLNISKKIPEEKIIEAVELLKNSGQPVKSISKQTGISKALLFNIKQGKTEYSEKIEGYNKSTEGAHNAKLTVEQVLEIKEKLKIGISRKELQAEYKISKTLVQLIATGQNWMHVDSSYEYKPLEVNGNAKLNDDIVRELKKDLDNMIARDIAVKYGISVGTVRQIKQGRTWKHVE